MNKIFASILIFSTLFTVLLGGYFLLESITHPIKYQNEIIIASKKYNLDPILIASIINVESYYNPRAKSNKNAIGLMQIKLSTANYMNELDNRDNIDENDLFSIETNIDYGCQYMRYLLDKFADPTTALAAYNAGETRVRSWLNGGVCSLDGKTLSYIPYKETRNYIEKINKNMKFYKKIYN